VAATCHPRTEIKTIPLSHWDVLLHPEIFAIVKIYVICEERQPLYRASRQLVVFADDIGLDSGTIL
jgi:hypothetical protein